MIRQGLRYCLMGLCLTVLAMSVAWAALPVAIEDKLLSANLAPSDLSVVVAPADGSPPILSHLAAVPRTPASTQKLVSTAVALDVLGGDFVWQNRIYHTGVLVGGVLYGDLVIMGSGDPALDYQRLNALLSALRDKVWRIHGDVYIDNHRFVNVSYDPNAFDGQGSRAYNATPQAFLVNFGTIEIKLTPSGRYRLLADDGDDVADFYPNMMANEAMVQVYPKLDGVSVAKRIAVNHDTCQLPKITLKPNAIVLTDTFGTQCGVQSMWRNFGDNNTLAIKAITAQLKALQFDFLGQVKIGQVHRHSLLPLVSLPSKPLRTQIAQINQFSNNVMTEQLALSLPLYGANLPSSDYQKAFSFITAWWQQKLTTPAPIMTRASGLCRDCRISTQSLASLLQLMYRHHAFADFLASLPVAGEQGTMIALAKRNSDHPAIGRAWIKTGTLNDVTAMAGYVQGDSKRVYVFVAMINGDNAGYHPKAVGVLDDLLAWTSEQ